MKRPGDRVVLDALTPDTIAAWQRDQPWHFGYVSSWRPSCRPAGLTMDKHFGGRRGRPVARPWHDGRTETVAGRPAWAGSGAIL